MRACGSTSGMCAISTAWSEQREGVDFVFHAAALKQVPSCEFFPIEAVKTNVLGSSNVIEASNANGVRSVVCLGTDKAAYPVNAMGMSKAMMEKVAQAFARNNPTANTVVSTVRYGNVMASRGSVIPLFIEQIKAGKPLTVTDPRHDAVPYVPRRGGLLGGARVPPGEAW